MTRSVYSAVSCYSCLLRAPAGVHLAGLAFTLRDLTQERLGSVPTLLAIGSAFLLSELADFAVYTPLRERNWLGAVAASNLVGLVVDSALFLTLAFGSLEFFGGQVIGKLWITALAILLLTLWRRGRVLHPASRV